MNEYGNVNSGSRMMTEPFMELFTHDLVKFPPKIPASAKSFHVHILMSYQLGLLAKYNETFFVLKAGQACSF